MEVSSTLPLFCYRFVPSIVAYYHFSLPVKHEIGEFSGLRNGRGGDRTVISGAMELRVVCECLRDRVLLFSLESFPRAKSGCDACVRACVRLSLAAAACVSEVE